jgi:hypothetical protein
MATTHNNKQVLYLRDPPAMVMSLTWYDIIDPTDLRMLKGRGTYGYWGEKF